MSVDPRALRVVVVSDAAPDRNGVGSYYRDLLENLGPLVGQFELIVPGGAHGEWIEMPLPGDPTQRVSVPALPHFARHLRTSRPDVLVVGTPGPYGLYGGRLASKLDIPVAFGFHTHFEHLTRLYWGPIMGRLSRWYLTTANRHLFRKAAVVLCHSESMLQLARELGASNARLAATLLPAAFLDEPPPLRESIGKVLFLGRLAAEKRVDRLLEAARELPELEFAFAGDGPLRERIVACAARERNVSFLGWQEREAIPALLAEHDLLVLPSDVEAFGTVALEAIACARTPLVSHRCGIRDWPELAASVFEFDPDRSLADAIRLACARPRDEREAIASRGRSAVLALNGQGVADWLELLGELANGRCAAA